MRNRERGFAFTWLFIGVVIILAAVAFLLHQLNRAAENADRAERIEAAQVVVDEMQPKLHAAAWRLLVALDSLHSLIEYEDRTGLVEMNYRGMMVTDFTTPLRCAIASEDIDCTPECMLNHWDSVPDVRGGNVLLISTQDPSLKAANEWVRARIDSSAKEWLAVWQPWHQARLTIAFPDRE